MLLSSLPSASLGCTRDSASKLGLCSRLLAAFLIPHSSFLIFFAFLSCGEDRTYEYVEATQTDHWMETAMREHYLWGDSLEDLDWDDYFDDPADFFAALTAQAPIDDDWSWCLVDTAPTDPRAKGTFDHLDSYGLDIVTLTDPTGSTSRQYARILTVYPNSPAEEAGITRGQFIGLIDDTKISSSNISKLYNGDARTLAVCTLDTDSTGEAYIWSRTDTLTLEASRYVEDLPFPTLTAFPDYDAAYLLCSRLTTGPTEADSTDTSYISTLQSCIEQLRDTRASYLILDLRLCNDGTLDMAQLLASYLYPDATDNTIFAQTIHRSDKAADDETLYFRTDVTPLPLSHLFVITSDYTHGAAEWVIRAIQAADPSFISLYGTTTGGECVATGRVDSDYYVTLHPAICYVADADGTYDYDEGIEPDYEIDEFEFVYLRPYGSATETLVATILQDLLP